MGQAVAEEVGVLTLGVSKRAGDSRKRHGVVSTGGWQPGHVGVTSDDSLHFIPSSKQTGTVVCYPLDSPGVCRGYRAQ